ncbi:MAG: hypothetical protein EA379_01700 [Phycisphaerales bacterium]|nr:MAG: hypothetical protein EA379_01700 [Phycisphaerales bacterium]
MPTPRYDILAVDLDGTLFDPRGRVSEANVRAIDAARAAGIEVVICTGRGLIESRSAIEAICARSCMPHLEEAPVIVAGGAIVADASTGRTVHRWPMNFDLVRRVAARLHDAELAAMVLKDPDAAGFDYLIVDTGELDPVNLWWFERMGVVRRHVPTLDHDEHPEHTVRVGFAASSERIIALGQEIMEEFRDQATLHHFAAVSNKHNKSDNYSIDHTVHILEAFDPDVNKWTALSWLADRRGVPRERVAAIGDEINDLTMVRGAGLGVAMANAVDPVRDIADRHAPSNAEDGVAYAVERILDGRW